MIEGESSGELGSFLARFVDKNRIGSVQKGNLFEIHLKVTYMYFCMPYSWVNVCFFGG